MLQDSCALDLNAHRPSGKRYKEGNQSSYFLYHLFFIHYNYFDMIITQEQIDAILSGIEDGLTIDQCCKYILHINRSNLYRHLTDEQKIQIKDYKILHAGFINDSRRKSLYYRKNKC